MRALKIDKPYVLGAILLVGAALLSVYGWLTCALMAPLDGTLLDVARNLSEGRGLTGNVVVTPFLPYYRDVHPPLPYCYYPLVPLVTAVLFRLFGAQAPLVLVLSVVSYLCAGGALYLLGRRLFGPVAGLAAAGFLLIQPAMIWTTMGSSLNDPVMVCLLITSVLCVFLARESKRSSTGWLTLAGAAMGVAQYARSAGLLLYLPMGFLVLSAFQQRRLARLAMFLGASLIVQAPLFVWRVRAFGSLTLTPTFHLLFLTHAFPGLNAVTQLLPTSPAEVLRLYGGDILRKWVSQVWVHYKYFFTMTHPLVLTAALLMFSRRLVRPQAVFRNFAVVLYGFLALQNSWNIWDNRYLLPAVPFLGLLGCAFLERAVSEMPVQRLGKQTAVAALALLVSSGTVDFFYQAAKDRGALLRSRQARAELMQFVKDNVRPGAVVMSTDAGDIAWENRNVAIELPADLETAERIHRDYIPFDTLILPTPLHLGGLYVYSPEWAELADGQAKLLGFRPEQMLTLSSGDRVVLLRNAEGRSMGYAGTGNKAVTVGRNR